MGAGAWGLSAALALAETGFTNVHVWERENAGSGNTARAAGLVSTHLREEQDIRWVLDTRRRFEALRAWGTEQGLPSAPHAFHQVGNVTISTKNDEFKLEQIRGRVLRAGGKAEFLSAAELARPAWRLKSTAHSSGLFSSDDGYVEAGDLIDLLQARVRSLGVGVHTSQAVGVDVTGSDVRGVTTTAGVEPCDQVLVAAGAWTKALLARSGLPLPVKPYRTQLAQLEFEHDASLPIIHDGEQGVYARADGPHRILVGDGTEHVESDPDAFNEGTDRGFIEKIAKSVSRRWQRGEAARYRTGWAGLCVGTPDRNAVIGPDPRVKHLHLMTGDNGFGLMRCLSLGALVAARLQGKMSPGAEICAPKRLDFGLKDFVIREGFEL
ncbi:MAG: FAD-binding oxidoreductase [Euryarchaeota archaeon]|nr:FAD-binding oxidoreductase [Euryarchaeota archaeon]